METTKRFEEAIELARELQSTLLSRDQKLKLFALFKQADGPAPPDPCGIKADGSFCEAEHATELEIAKVRQQAPRPVRLPRAPLS